MGVFELVAVLAWPAALLAVVIVLRSRLGGVLSAPIKRIKVGPGGFEAEWWRHAVQQRVVEAGSAPTDGTGGGQLGRRTRCPADPTVKDAAPRLHVVFVGWSGGRGTSTQALYTANALAEKGLKVTLLDCHPRHDLVHMCRAVPELPFEVRSLPGAELAYRADRVAAGSDVVVIDSPALNGANADIAHGCVAYADEVVVPVPTAEHETRAVLPIAERLRLIRPELRSCALLWGGRTNSRSTPIARAFLEAQGFDVLAPVVYLRDAYAWLTALLGPVSNDAFPAVAEVLIERHNRSTDEPLGHIVPMPRHPRRKATPLTARERKEHRARVLDVIHSPRADPGLAAAS